MKAVDDIKLLEREITKQDASVRQPRDGIRSFLLTSLAAPMNGTGQRLIHQFCDMYEHARHDPSEFGHDEYEAYRRILLKLHEAYEIQIFQSVFISFLFTPIRCPFAVPK